MFKVKSFLVTMFAALSLFGGIAAPGLAHAASIHVLKPADDFSICAYVGNVGPTTTDAHNPHVHISTTLQYCNYDSYGSANGASSAFRVVTSVWVANGYWYHIASDESFAGQSDIWTDFGWVGPTGGVAVYFSTTYNIGLDSNLPGQTIRGYSQALGGAAYTATSYTF